jgi:hypothetical protein
MNKQISRRQFILRSIEGAVATSFIAPTVFELAAPGPRLGIAGLGERGGTLLNACIHGSVKVAALCDVDPLAIRRGKARVPKAAVYLDFEQLAAGAGVDAVAVATPRASSLAEAALRRGKHVFLASPDRPDLEAINRLARLARERSLQIGLAPHDPSWDIDGLNQLLGTPASLENTRTRISLFASNADRDGGPIDFGLDLLHHAVRCAGNRAPSKVRAVSTAGFLGGSWSASFILERDSTVYVHAQTLPNLKPGEMSIVLEASGRGSATRVVVYSIPESGMESAPVDPQRPGLARFLAAVGGKAPSQDGTELSLGVLRWSCMLRNALTS